MIKTIKEFIHSLRSWLLLTACGAVCVICATFIGRTMGNGGKSFIARIWSQFGGDVILGFTVFAFVMIAGFLLSKKEKERIQK